MRAIKPNMRHRSLWRTVLLALVAIVIGGAGTVAALAGFKVIDPGKLAFWRTPERPIPADWIRHSPFRSADSRLHDGHPRLPVESEDCPVVIVYKPPKAVPKEVITRLSRDPRPRHGTGETRGVRLHGIAIFCPRALAPAWWAARRKENAPSPWTPANSRAAHDLKEGDHVDLLASIPVDMPGAGRSGAGRLGTNVVATPDMASLPKRSLVRPLVQDGVVVTPVRTRNVPISSSSLTQGMTTRTVPVQEIVLAVDPRRWRRWPRPWT